jgi:hypothetical protein
VLLITSETYRFRKNRCNYPRSRNIYADLKVGEKFWLSSLDWEGLAEQKELQIP